MLGNDVVDLGTRDAAGKADDARFLQRVFTADEAACIRGSPHRDRVLWMHWAGKEAAFKAVQKLRPGTPFAHRAFAVRLEGAERGVVALPDAFGLEPLRLEYTLTALSVHCIAMPAAVAPEVIRSDVATMAVDTSESLAVRQLAKRLAREAGAGDVEIVRDRCGRIAGPPYVAAAGDARRLEGWDVSLSHHGSFVAAVVARFGTT